MRRDKELRYMADGQFTRRKKWPQILLQELMGGALFCLKPYPLERSSMDASGRTNNTTGWKVSSFPTFPPAAD